MNETKTRRFNNNDWDSYAGATPFADGTDPLIRYIGDQWIAIADGTGLFVQRFVDDEERQPLETDWTWLVDFPSSSFARFILDSLPEEITDDYMLNFGFEYDER